MYLRSFLPIILLNLIISLKIVQCKEKSFATSIISMEELLNTEQLLIDTLDKYTKELQSKVDALKNLISELRFENEKALGNREVYIYNALNCYSIIRRMHQDWNKIEKFMKKPIGYEYLKVIQDYLPHLPKSSDLHEASEAIYRLQSTYDLEAKDMAEGILNGKQYSVKLKAIDRFSMGHHLLTLNEYYLASYWLNSALDSYKASDYNKILEFDKSKIWHLYGETLLGQNHLQNALTAFQKASALQPDNVFLRNRLKDIEYLARANVMEPITFTKPNATDYELGCRGAFSRIPSRYYCIYNTTTTAFLLLAPLKMEILQLSPYIVIYHDVILQTEIEELLQKSKPNLVRSTVYKMGQREIVEHRTSQFTYFDDDFSNSTLRIHERVKDMTGFDLAGSDKLQVVNYVLGGHYYAHYDFFNVTDSTEVVRSQGDRIATVLFYLSDVEQGGATIFPNIRTAVIPRKGSALVWYNLNNQLQGDERTLHAACPVIVGSKWISNKWIRVKAQTFKKPCLK